MSTEPLSPEAALADEPAYQPAPDESMVGQQAPVEDATPPPQDSLDPIAHLPLNLTLRCGQLTLSLEQLSQLGSGSVLEVQGIAPGHASLCHGEQVVGEGELVEVDGRLGLQITRMASLV